MHVYIMTSSAHSTERFSARGCLEVFIASWSFFIRRIGQAWAVPLFPQAQAFSVTVARTSPWPCATSLVEYDFVRIKGGTRRPIRRTGLQCFAVTPSRYVSSLTQTTTRIWRANTLELRCGRLDGVELLDGPVSLAVANDNVRRTAVF